MEWTEMSKTFMESQSVEDKSQRVTRQADRVNLINAGSVRVDYVAGCTAGVQSCEMFVALNDYIERTCDTRTQKWSVSVELCAIQNRSVITVNGCHIFEFIGSVKMEWEWKRRNFSSECLLKYIKSVSDMQ